MLDEYQQQSSSAAARAVLDMLAAGVLMQEELPEEIEEPLTPFVSVRPKARHQ